ncbi:death-associated inhibitor of apoptosis 2 isoform X2 [Polistes fuscatus]|uniref:death-associated inhibitor of apoptosis 2 isoform X2 n=1 Tax=Polistes fuscatus TaxID=30207 RepID=UPI001CA99ED8|nr:death-associated inhibitor of apoptosis 2 isoform X2 [Polistes fuscatus]
MNNEENRLRTFSNWPSIAPISAERVAKAGFFYTGIGLEVQCFLCGTRVTEWDYGDQVIVRHRNAAPDCPFVLDPSSTCNIPLVPASNDSRESLSLNARPRSHCETNQPISLRREEIDSPTSDFHQRSNDDIVQLTNVEDLISGSTTDFQDLGIRTHNSPRCPNFSSYTNRLFSYFGWPKGHLQTPQTLADAGFYYIKYEDHVRCYYCDGGLHHWEDTDDPWVEHAKWFPRCGFVNLMKGQEFINQCIASRPSADRMIEGSSNHNQSGINKNETEENIVTITEGIGNNTINITERTGEIEIETSKTNAPYGTESPSATELPSATESTSETELPSATFSSHRSRSVTETTSATKTTSANNLNVEDIRQKFLEFIVERAMSGQLSAADEIYLPEEAKRMIKERCMGRTINNNFSRTTEPMQDCIRSIENNPNRAKRLHLNKADIIQRCLNLQIK